MAVRDITEGRAARSIAFELGIGTLTTSSNLWQNKSESYEVAVGGLPFYYGINNERPYIRQTLPYRKEQFDSSSEPGEQSLTGWWLRSQSSFHGGSGIKFYDPSAGETVAHRFADSKGVDVWTKGQATLLSSCSPAHITTGAMQSNGRKFQTLRSIEWNGNKGVLLADEYDVDKIDSNGAVTDFIDYNAGASSAVLALCDDGVTAFWLTNYTSGGVTKKTVFGKPLIGSAASTADEFKIGDATGSATNAVMEYVKERIILCMDNGIYEVPAVAGVNLPTALYTHPTASHVYTSITASGAAIYVAGYTGIQSSIQKFTLTTAGLMPTLSQAVVAAEMPVGEIIHCIKYYLGYMMIGTNKGIRASIVQDDGSVNYGPLILETSQPVYDFACRDRFIWATTSVAGEPGTTRIDLGNEIETLRFAYANDIYYPGISGRMTTSCAFIDGTEQLAFTTTAVTAGTKITNKVKTSGIVTLTTFTAHGLLPGDAVWIEGVDAVGGSAFNSTITPFDVIATPTTTTFTYALAGINVASTAVTVATAKANLPGATYIESATELMASGEILTGNIRFNTLEPKHFERIIARGDFDFGTLSVNTVDRNQMEYEAISYSADFDLSEGVTSQPATSQEFLAYRFVFLRDVTYSQRGPVFKGYQSKALIATKRQRILQFPVYCYDMETDKNNVTVGYDGRAMDRILELEAIEESGDVVVWQDLTTKEVREVQIDSIQFTRMTPPEKRFNGFGGVILVTLHTV